MILIACYIALGILLGIGSTGLMQISITCLLALGMDLLSYHAAANEYTFGGWMDKRCTGAACSFYFILNLAIYVALGFVLVGNTCFLPVILLIAAIGTIGTLHGMRAAKAKKVDSAE